MACAKNATKFTIEDAFDENLDEVVIRVYGSTTVNKSPLKDKLKQDDNVEKHGSPGTRSHSHAHPVLLSIKTGVLTDDTASKDSDSLIHDSYHFSQTYFDPNRIWWQHPRVQENWKVVLGAAALVVIGIGLFVTGISVLLIPLGGAQGLVFLIAGAICFIPGAYHIVYIYLAVKGRRGYEFYDLPLFN